MSSRPICDHCRRSHAHAVRSATRNETDIPVLLCEWVDDDDPTSTSEPSEAASAPAPSQASKKKAVAGKNAVKSGGLQREKNRRQEEDREVLLARIGTSSIGSD